MYWIVMLVLSPGKPSILSNMTKYQHWQHQNWNMQKFNFDPCSELTHAFRKCFNSEFYADTQNSECISRTCLYLWYIVQNYPMCKLNTFTSWCFNIYYENQIVSSKLSMNLQVANFIIMTMMVKSISCHKVAVPWPHPQETSPSITITFCSRSVSGFISLSKGSRKVSSRNNPPNKKMAIWGDYLWIIGKCDIIRMCTKWTG